MKKMIIGLTLIASASSFASDCKSLAGKFNCNYQGGDVLLKIVSKPKTKTFNLNIEGEGQEVIANGKLQNSKTDDTQYIATCKENKELIIDNFFKGELKGSISVLETNNGVLYTLVQSRSTLELKCNRVK